ncbi:EamA family transporter [Acinetobacter courvalinii]|jgi:drug/metabolite transporter (DMT)-like permease|uniref:EamA family transporter n=1 Tax=Acinetobacter TaxID=469 RepID=UPI00045232D1|nr:MULTISPECIES: EamA family transporter [Acinetobacter]EXB27617.1 sugar transport family protein [Acinetobacter baumannii 1437282]MCU4390613.1 EamA family transporter [Acinetobacter courvalinii]MDR2060994.1 EamA family transporter [Acinetobacter sp.]
MEMIVAAACCSVLVSIVLKYLKAKGFDVFQMIAWNYLSASILCYYWFKTDLTHISFNHTPWWLILVLAVLLPSIFLCLAKSLQFAGILKTEIAQRLAVILSLLAAYFIFGEHFSQIKLIGVVLGIIAILAIIIGQATEQASKGINLKSALFLFSVWAGYAAIDVLLKYSSSLGLQSAVTLNLAFIGAFILSIAYIAITQPNWQPKNIFTGLVLGVLNFANIALYVKAHMLFKETPAIVFAGMNILVVVLGVLSGVIFFKERLQAYTWIGLVSGIVAVLCLAKAMM